MTSLTQKFLCQIGRNKLILIMTHGSECLKISSVMLWLIGINWCLGISDAIDELSYKPMSL